LDKATSRALNELIEAADTAETSRTVPVQTLAKVYEDRAENYTRAAERTDDPVFRRLLLMLALQWKQAAQEEAKSKDASTSRASS
jgi:hypothetical protein